MSEKKRFHPLALVIFLFEGFKTWGFFFILAFINFGFGNLYAILAYVGLLFIVLVTALVKYFTQSYQISPEKIVIYHGVLRKHEVDIPYDRIQTVKQRQWFFLEPFHVIQILIETAGGSSDKAEASLAAVDESLLDQIERYRQALEDDPDEVSVSEEPAAEVVDGALTGTTTGPLQSDVPLKKVRKDVPEFIYQVTNTQIFLFGVTDLSILAMAVVLFGFVDDFIPDNWLDAAKNQTQQLARAGWLFLVGSLFLVLLVITIVSLIKNFLQYYNFKVIRQRDTLTIESGLLERKVQKIPLEKIQGIKIHQQVLRKLLGISSVELLLAGGQETDGESGFASKLYFLPIVEDQKMFEALDFLLPEWDFDQPEIEFVSRKRLFYFWRWAFLITIPAGIIGFIWINHWLALAAALVLVVWLLMGWLDCRYQGYAIQGKNRICIQNFSGASKVQTFIERPKIQSMTESTSIWLFKRQIGHLSLAIKTGTQTTTAALRFIDRSALQKLVSFYRG